MSTTLHRRALLAATLVLCAAPALRADESTTSMSNGNGTFKVTTGYADHPNKIKIEFEPDADAVDCSKIVLVQTVKRYLDGELVRTPSTVTKKWKYKDDDTVDGTGVDHLFCETDAGYNGDDKQDHGQQGSGSGDGSSTTASDIIDAPYYSDTTFGRTGKSSVRLEFETCAVCVEGTQAGTNYGCVTWKYERGKGDDDDGTSTLTSTSVGTASAAFTAALTRFNENHTQDGSPVCPEEKPADDCGKKEHEKVGPMTLMVADDYSVDVADAGVTVGSAAGDPGTALHDGDPLAPGAWVQVPQGRRVCLTRTGTGLPGTGPLLATFTELVQGGLENVETGQCAGFGHGGVRVVNVDGLPLAAAAGEDNPSPNAFLMFSAVADVGAQTVLFRNDPLSTHGLWVVDELGTLQTLLLPGQQVELVYPGLMLPPLPPAPGFAVCFGDGTGNACPCDNDSPVLGAGCVNSSGAGMTIRGQGSASAGADDLQLVAEGCPPGNTGIFYAGTIDIAGGNPLYEGLQCAGGDVRRFHGVFQATGTAVDGGFVAQDPSGVYFQPGQGYTFQYWTRDVQTRNGGCSAIPGIGANFSPGYRVVFTP